ncbi:MAG: phosphoglucomutase/phosphomannomutase family protein [Dehalococcoidia bacterium]|nr:phosphoglucomutase/phosphomannomutase family protein [Dehalococcoidia bacterium]
MTPKIKFGTDGWRGIIADDFTFANVRYCAQAVAEHLRDQNLAPRGMVVGYDTRFASERFAAAVAEVFAGNGIKTLLCQQATPTPIVSYGVTHEKAAGAVIITASHNPGQWNGFKIKSPDGSSAPTQVEADVESRLPQIIAQDRVKRLELEECLSKGIIRYVDLSTAYFDHISGLVDLQSLRQSGLRIAVDSMFGAGSGYFKRALGGGNTEVIEINGERNPIFPGIQPEPIARHLKKLSVTVQDTGASIGLATDGDADRIGAVDEKGQPLTPLQIFALLALYFFEVRGERGPIVRTITTTSMLDRLGKIYGVPVYETKVGFKYVAPVMMSENALIGGEESSGFGFRGHIPERDGILAGLYLLDFMNRLKKFPSQLIDYLYSKVGPHHYNRVDLEFPPADREKIIARIAGKTPAEIGGARVVKVNTADGFHFALADGSWLLVRFSGTEPILRIYAEASTLERANLIIAEGKRLLGV